MPDDFEKLIESAGVGVMGLRDHSSLRAKVLLGEFVRLATEMSFVLHFSEQETSLDLTELSDAVHWLRGKAGEAYHASQLLEQGAALTPKWGSAQARSRPSAVLARHREAGDRYGAPMVVLGGEVQLSAEVPDPPSAPSMPGMAEGTVEPPPARQCRGRARSGAACRGWAVQLLSGRAEHCRVHLTREERGARGEFDAAVEVWQRECDEIREAYAMAVRQWRLDVGASLVAAWWERYSTEVLGR